MESDPLGKVDLARPLFSEDTDELVRDQYYDDRDRRYFKDKNFEADYEWLETKFPARKSRSLRSTRDDGQWLVSAHGDTEPGETYLFGRMTQKLSFNTKFAKNCRASRWRRCRPSVTHLPMAWKSPPT